MRSSGAGLPSGRLFNAPYFDATDPEDRNNEQLAGCVSYFLTTSRGGSHDVKGGWERFNSSDKGGNSQTSTGYVYWTPYLTSGGEPVCERCRRRAGAWRRAAVRRCLRPSERPPAATGCDPASPWGLP